MKTRDYNIIAVIGPTASGKTAFASHLAFTLNGEIISADSRQVYRYMNKGTGKDYDDYLVNGKRIPVHLIDIADPGYKYSIFEYQRDFYKTFNDITARGKMPVLCGGSGMYIDAATRNYQLIEVPENFTLRRDLKYKTLAELTHMLSEMKILHNKTDIDNIERAIRAIEIQKYYNENPQLLPQHPEIKPAFIGILFDRGIERERITYRLRKRLQEGLVDEVRQLISSGVAEKDLIYYGLEYKHISIFLSGMVDYETMVSRLNTAIHQFAKRQRTWFRKMEREGCKIHWIDGTLSMEAKLEEAVKVLC
jgi:tRNA dimethylallyltransferase